MTVTTIETDPSGKPSRAIVRKDGRVQAIAARSEQRGSRDGRPFWPYYRMAWDSLAEALADYNDNRSVAPRRRTA